MKIKLLLFFSLTLGVLGCSDYKTVTGSAQVGSVAVTTSSTFSTTSTSTPLTTTTISMMSQVGVLDDSSAPSVPPPGNGNTIVVGPGDSYSKIEAAQPGDTVLIAPGTYSFRVFLNQPGTSTAPIYISAQDPTNRPVFDYSSMNSDRFPGSDTSNSTRGCWHVWTPGAYYVIDGLIIKGCHSDSGNAAGLRNIQNSNLTIRHSLFENNQNGLFGNGDNTLVEFSEFNANGNTDQEHNMYVTGGSLFFVRYSFLHDVVGGQNFHVRAANSVFEYNWIARGGDYEGDMDNSGSGAPQFMLLKGNVFVTNPSATSKIIGFLDDSASNLTYNFTAIWNTFVVSSSTNMVLQLAMNGTTNIVFSNNIVSGTSQSLIQSASSGSSAVQGNKNWFLTGTNIGSLLNTIFGTTPGFSDASTMDFTLSGLSACVGVADTSATNKPLKEYFKNETVPLNYRTRATANDIGAFESTTTGPGQSD